MSSPMRNGYIPLATTGSTFEAERDVDQLRKPWRWFTRGLAWVLSLLLALALLHSVVFRRLVDPFENYQILNTIPMVTPVGPSTREERAVVTTLYTDAYVHGVATLGHSIRAVNTTARLMLAYFPDKISPAALCVAQAGGWELVPIGRIPPPHNGKGVDPAFIDQYSKLSMWGFDKRGIKSIVYLDGDTLVRNNFDELFDLPYPFAAGLDIWTDDRAFSVKFNAGVMFLRPSTAVYQDMLSKMETAEFSLKMAEQEYLNAYFGAHVLRLPFVYNGNLAIKTRSQHLWTALQHDMRVVHYTLVKPFPSRTGPMSSVEALSNHLKQKKEKAGMFEQELQWWEDSWNAMREAQWPSVEKCFAEHSASDTAVYET